jgi:hypothetical protein
MPLITVGTSAVQLQAGASQPGHIQIKSGSENAGIIYVAARSNVTTGATPATTGLPLTSGEAIMIPSYHQKDASMIYAIADSAGQNLYYEVITGP